MGLELIKEGEVLFAAPPQARLEYSMEERTCALYSISSPLLSRSHEILVRDASFPEASLVNCSICVLKVNHES